MPKEEKDTEKVLKGRKKTAAAKIKIPPVEFISTGCIPFNLALSQKGRDGGIARGRIINFVGDGSSGKTINALEVAASYYYTVQDKESQIFPPVKKHTVRYNNSEGVMDFPVAEMYGEEFFDDVEWVHFDQVQNWGVDVQKSINGLKSGESMLYICDSLDALIPREAKERIEKQIKDGKTPDGSYGLEAQKYLSKEFFNDLCSRMEGKDFTLLIISQVRENLNAGGFGKKFRRNGGKALDFYTHQVAWLYSKEKFKKTYKGNDRIYGTSALAKIERNKTAIPYREAVIPIMFDYGVDNIKSMADFLFGPKDKLVKWEEEEVKKSQLIDMAYDDIDIENKLIYMTEAMWADIEENTKTHRPKKFNKFRK